MAALLLACFFMPVGKGRFDSAVIESLHLVKWYAREHLLLCLVPAFFIAGAISVFVGQASVIKHLGARAGKVTAYGVASVSGTVLAVCSCTVLPLFAGIFRMGAGIGPATAFLYSGPAINILAMILTARVLGLEIGVARAVGAVLFSVVIGLAMHFLFRKDENEKAAAQAALPEKKTKRNLRQNAVFFACMVAVLVFANWAGPDRATGFWHAVWSVKWWLTAGSGLALGCALTAWFGLSLRSLLFAAAPVAALAILFPERPAVAFMAAVLGLCIITGARKGETREWLGSSWGFAKQILPLLLIGVILSGTLLGRPGQEGLIPSSWIAGSVGGNSLTSNFFASAAGAIMYFATLTEVPILEGLIGNGMGKGPALALLLAGPAISLPNMIVIHSVMGLKRTAAFVCLVVLTATISGFLYGSVF